MEGLSSLVLGLGLFFLGMQLVGENLRRLSGRSFRNVMQRVSERPALAAAAGIGFGAVMQSATAVTFILASMQKSGLISTAGAAPVILWCNVGLTALVFLATLDIHPMVAYFTGAAGILSAMIRQSMWRSVAGGLLGVGLILFGLQSMAEGAEPLRAEAWFQALMAGAVSLPWIAFGVGIVAAAVLESNTGAAMLVITLAAAGQFDLEQAALLIYGTNLGAIGLRAILAMNLDNASKRLVRFEDIFCIWTGIVMVILTLIESLGLPGPLALARAVSPDSLEFQLAVLFLVSNLFPAIALSPFTGRVMQALGKWMPEGKWESFATPKFLSPTAVEDPGTATDLALRESARLLESLKIQPHTQTRDVAGESSARPEFVELASTIERFLAQVATSNRLEPTEAHALHLIRAELGVIRYLEESVRGFNEYLDTIKNPTGDESPAAPMVQSLSALLDQAVECATHPKLDSVAEFREATRKNNDAVKAVRDTALTNAKNADPETGAAVSALRDSYDLVIWMMHRLAKTLERCVNEI